MSEQPRFHLDESVTTGIADLLRSRGGDCTTTPDAALTGRPDGEQFAFARSESRVIVTADYDFLRLAAVDPDHPGVVFWRKTRHFSAFVRDLDALRFEFTADELRGRVLYYR